MQEDPELFLASFGRDASTGRNKGMGENTGQVLGTEGGLPGMSEE